MGAVTASPFDPFAALGVPRSFDVDLASLEKVHRELSRALHPDRYADRGASERRSALEKAATVNEAFRTVKDPVRRAEALFRLRGVAVGETNEPKPSATLLMLVMEQREELADARKKKDRAQIEKLASEMRAKAKIAEGALSQGFSAEIVDGDAVSLVSKLGELRYCRRFLEEVRAIEEELDEAEANDHGAV